MTESEKPVKLSIYGIPPELRKAFHQKCSEDGIKRNTLILKFLEAYAYHRADNFPISETIEEVLWEQKISK